MTSYESYLELIREIDALIEAFEQHPDPATREHVVALLECLDGLHREGLHRLADLLHKSGAEWLMDRLTEDPVVETLLGLYDVVDLDLPEAPPEQQTRQPQVFIPEEELTVLSDPDDDSNTAAPQDA